MSEKGPKERGRTSPTYSLEEAITYAQQIKNEVGSSPASREMVTKALGHESSTSGSGGVKIGTLTHYGLLDVVGRGSYQLSSLAIQILTPQDENEKRLGLVEAAKSPALYRDLLAAYQGQAIPGLLPNILTRQYRVAEKRASEVGDTFRKTMEFAGLLRQGILYSEPPTTAENAGVAGSSPGFKPSPSSSRDSGSVTKQGQTVSSDFDDEPAAPPTGCVRYQIVLPRNRFAYLSMPGDCSEADLDKVAAWINFNKKDLIEEKAAGTEDASG